MRFAVNFLPCLAKSKTAVSVPRLLDAFPHSCYTIPMSTPYKPKLYIETTVFNFYTHGKAQQKQQSTLALFERIKAGDYEVYTSDYAVAELEGATAEQYAEMLALIEKYGIKRLAKTDEAKRLGDVYMARGIVPSEYPGDDWQIALATIKGFDCVVSWNMGHIVKTKAMI